MVVVVVLLEAKAAVIARLGTLVQVDVDQRVAEGSSSCTSTEGASAPLYTKMHEKREPVANSSSASGRAAARKDVKERRE